MSKEVAGVKLYPHPTIQKIQKSEYFLRTPLAISLILLFSQLIFFVESASAIAPTVKQVLPISGTTLGGTYVTIDGFDIDAGATASLGGVACSGIQVYPPNKITCYTGPHSAGLVDATITNPGNLVGTLNNAYTYIAPPTVQWTTSNQNSTENGTMVVTAQLSFTTNTNVTVPFTIGGTAANGSDYAINPTTITIPPNSQSGSATISIINDLLDETYETIILTMGNPTGATLGANTIHTATIIDDDGPPTVQWTSAGNISVSENIGTYTITAQLSAISGVNVTVPFTINGSATNTVDYSLSPVNQLTIPAGSTTANITVFVVNDLMDENSETIVLTMQTPTGATLGLIAIHTLTIVDNDPAPTVTWTLDSQKTSECTQDQMFITAQLSNPSSFTVTVPFSVSGTATNGADYGISSSPLTIPPGALTGQITVNVFDEGAIESDETIIVTMGNPTNAGQGAITVHTATIQWGNLMYVMGGRTATAVMHDVWTYNGTSWAQLDDAPWGVHDQIMHRLSSTVRFM